MIGSRVAAALCLMGSMATPSLAQEAAEDWQFQAVVYLWLPAIGGETAFPGDGGGEGPGIDVAKILENLNLVFMGSLGMEKGRWGVFTDVVYLDIGDSDSPARSFTIGEGLPVNASASVRYDLNGWLTTVAGTWSLASAPGYEVNLVGGTRLIDVDQAIDWQLSGNVGSIPIDQREGVRMTGVRNWDAIIGLRGRARLGESRRWIVPFYADAGAGESDFTWQLMAGLGYEFGWGDAMLAWRHVDYDMKADNAIASVTFDGPTFGAAFRW